jgi:hypothetical protein
MEIDSIEKRSGKTAFVLLDLEGAITIMPWVSPRFILVGAMPPARAANLTEEATLEMVPSLLLGAGVELRGLGQRQEKELLLDKGNLPGLTKVKAGAQNAVPL